uniref:Uncharacterized protein n=1 Tax=Brassica oleracea TaxID=3712 RepID=A0A3P6EJX5_BRAOL|nr:unnamed protein product [Brassica oleracea]
MVHCCLDRVMANSCWFSEFPAYEMVFLELGESDHRPLRTTKKNLFYDICMYHKEGFKETVYRVVKVWPIKLHSSTSYSLYK